MTEQTLQENMTKIEDVRVETSSPLEVVIAIGLSNKERMYIDFANLHWNYDDVLLDVGVVDKYVGATLLDVQSYTARNNDTSKTVIIEMETNAGTCTISCTTTYQSEEQENNSHVCRIRVPEQPTITYHL